MNRDAEQFLDSRIPAPESFLAREEGAFLIVGDCKTSSGLMLNGMARQILRMCDGHTSVGDIIGTLVARYGPEMEGRIRQDVYGVLRNLEFRHILSIRRGCSRET